MKTLYILGTGSQAKYVIENNRASQDYQHIVLVDLLSRENVGQSILGHKIVYYIDEFWKQFPKSDSDRVIIAIGQQDLKRALISKLQTNRAYVTNSIHPHAFIAKDVVLGQGLIINPQVTIMPDNHISDFCIIHSGSVLEHDNHIGINGNIGPGVICAGNVHVGDHCILYTGVKVAPKVKIANNIVVGMGSAVFRDLDQEGLYYGCPARLQKR